MITPPLRGGIDWERTRETLLRIQEINPAFTTENCLIGGSAAWFYRNLLERKNDPDFPPVKFTEEEEAVWYSKDVDFIGTKKKDYPEELQTQPEGDPPRFFINGVWVDTPDEGLFITGSIALKTALEIENPQTGSLYKTASPVLLYREKKALIQKTKAEGTQERPQDILHLRTFWRASGLLISSLAEKKNPSQREATLLFKLIKETQEIAPEIFNDKLAKRLQNQLNRLHSDPRTKAVYHLLKNQVLKSDIPSEAV
jgi:hypothetical protein